MLNKKTESFKLILTFNTTIVDGIVQLPHVETPAKSSHSITGDAAVAVLDVRHNQKVL